MNQEARPSPSAGYERTMTTELKSSSFMMENLLKPDQRRTVPECPKEPPAKIKALSVAAQLAGLMFSYNCKPDSLS